MAETRIHPCAVVEPGASLGEGVSIGPFCHVGADAVLGDRVTLVGHVTIMGATTLGEGCTVYPMATLGAPPQNAKHKGGRTTLEIGRNCTIREGVTMHLGTDTSRGRTTVGEDGNFLAYTHIAHDCAVGRSVTMANVATLGGHVTVDDFATLGGLSAVHQFCHIGHHAFVGGGVMVRGNVIPFGMVGPGGALKGLNLIGLKRSGQPRAAIHELRRAYRLIFDRSRTVAENLELAEARFAGSAAVADMLGFIRAGGHRHLAVPALSGGVGDDDEH
jgi:UDP-N-acetylglucosamine acyltransferase